MRILEIEPDYSIGIYVNMDPPFVQRPHPSVCHLICYKYLLHDLRGCGSPGDRDLLSLGVDSGGHVTKPWWSWNDEKAGPMANKFKLPIY